MAQPDCGGPLLVLVRCLQHRWLGEYYSDDDVARKKLSPDLHFLRFSRRLMQSLPVLAFSLW